MEHRWTTRKQHECRVFVECHYGGSFLARVRDVGLGGMFIETTAARLPLHAPVEVAFKLGDDKYRDEFRLEAMVIRHSDGGVALAFLETATDILGALRGRYYDADIPAAPLSAAADTPQPSEVGSALHNRRVVNG